AWLGISQAATGDPLGFFAKRAHYQAEYLDFYPTRHGFLLADIWQDFDYLLLGANRGIVLASVVAGGLFGSRAIQQRRINSSGVTAILGYGAAFFGFMLF